MNLQITFCVKEKGEFVVEISTEENFLETKEMFKNKAFTFISEKFIPDVFKMKVEIMEDYEEDKIPKWLKRMNGKYINIEKF